jgi:alkanesulfonate monooxygenase SsuD/methylene tetrahydromethanopterin reductase-like flavin-dependent oxidoreductase (luciferase family)
MATVDTVAIRLGFQIPNFSYGTGIEQLFPTVIAQAREAESAGFDSVFVMDHFYQLPMLGDPDQPMLEAYTALGALATATERVQLGTLVTGNTYRNPTVLAKIITTLDVISQGRAILGIGTGWFELEHDQLGFDFGTFTDRFNRLDEALEIILPMIKGERNGFLLAARYFDHLNVIAGFDELARKVQVVQQECEKIGRDPATLETSMLITVMVSDDIKPDQIPAEMSQRMVAGSPDSIADQIQTKVIDAGIDSVIINMPFYTPGVINAVGEALRPLVGLQVG